MIEGFEELVPTQVGRVAENIVKMYIEKKTNFYVEEDTSEVYDKKKDFRVSNGKLSFFIEVKGDNYPKGYNIALEHKQQNLKGDMVPSSLSTTESEYIYYYVFRWDRLYIFEKRIYDEHLSRGFISDEDSKVCNSSSETGMTECYILEADFLEVNGFFSKVVNNVALDLGITSTQAPIVSPLGEARAGAGAWSA